MAACPGGFCAPDPVIATDNNYVPPTCASLAGAEGRCLSTCLPPIAAEAIHLPTAGCPQGTVCAPCYDPTSADPQTQTGACSLGCDKPALPPTVITCPWNVPPKPPVVVASTFPACAPTCAGAHCLPAANVPVAEQSLLAACPGGFCAPDPIIAAGGEYVPPSCVAFANTTAEGRCMSTCIPQIASEASELHQKNCVAGDLCAPCYDPFTGADTGACELACDKPKQTKYVFPTCCPFNGSNTGTCVPTENVPASEQSNLQQLTCPSTLLCVPDEDLPGHTGKGCSGKILGFIPYSGSCISNCANLGLGELFPQGSCDGIHTCIPCAEAPAGSPGC